MDNRFFSTNGRLVSEQQLRSASRWFDFPTEQPISELTPAGALSHAEPPYSDGDADRLEEDEQSIRDAISRRAELEREAKRSGIPVITIPKPKPKAYAPTPKIRIPPRDDKPISEQIVMSPENSARKTKTRPNRVRIGNEIVMMSDAEWENF